MALKIIVEPHDDPASLMTHELDQSLVTVGRSKSCHIELDHPQISRRHFIVKYEETGYVMLDENSRHGTLLDQQKLEPQRPYPLGAEHAIEVPGFRIRVMCDGEKPRLERTTVVARKLLDDLLQGEIRPREVPTLREKDGVRHFKFVEEKTTFVLGSFAHADFVVDEEHVAKKHVSFIRDIFGIRVVPTPGNEIKLDNVAIVEPKILGAGATITIGSHAFVYTESEAMPAPTTLSAPIIAVASDPPRVVTIAERHEQVPPEEKPKRLFRALDRIFVLGFVAVIVGAVLVVVNLA